MSDSRHKAKMDLYRISILEDRPALDSQASKMRSLLISRYSPPSSTSKTSVDTYSIRSRGQIEEDLSGFLPVSTITTDEYESAKPRFRGYAHR